MTSSRSLRSVSCGRLAPVVVYALALTAGIGAVSSARGDTLCLRPQDSVWIVSTRGLCRCPARGESGALATSQYIDGSWQRLTFADLAADSSPERTDVLFAHGNAVESNEVGELVCKIYRALTACDGPPVRLIFWSWPSDKQAGLIRDVLAKDARTAIEAAWMREALTDLPHVGPRSLVGYSFGARIVAAATAAYEPAIAESRPPQRAILIAAAADRCDLAPNGEYSRAYQRLDRLSVWYNTGDPALKRYHLLAADDALGYLGMPGRWSAIGACRIDQTNVTAWIGRTHWLSEYLGDSRATSLLRRQSLWEDEAPASPQFAGVLKPQAAVAAR